MAEAADRRAGPVATASGSWASADGVPLARLPARSPDWLADRRRAAWDAFRSLPMPSSAVDEDWRRTDVSRLRLDRFRLAGDEPPSPSDGAEALSTALRRRHEQAAPEAALAINGEHGAVDISGREALAEQGVVVCSLEDAAMRRPDLVRRGLASVAVGESPFLALWNAVWRGGCFIHVPASVDAAVPVWVAHTALPGAAAFPATIAILEDNASLSLVDIYASPSSGDALFSDAVACLVLGNDARLDYGCLQQWGPEAWHVSLHRAVLARNAQLRFFAGTFGSRLQKSYWDCLLDGRGADAAMTGICFGDGQQHLDNQTLQAHRAPQTRSDLLLKVAVRDRARSVYSGLIDVEKQAMQTDGYVQNRNLMLSPGAIADSVPRLEIKANDVRCGHGATAGHVDEEQRFYLQSRGVPAAEAEKLIVRGFMADALDRIPHAGLRRLVADILDEEIAGRAQLGISGAGVGDGSSGATTAVPDEGRAR